MDEPQIIKSPSGEEMVVLSRKEYDELLDALSEAEEELADIATLDCRKLEILSGATAVLPAAVSQSILQGSGRLRALRLWRGVSETEMAAVLGVGQAELQSLEEQRTPLPPDRLARVAEKLSVPTEWLAG